MESNPDLLRVVRGADGDGEVLPLADALLPHRPAGDEGLAAIGPEEVHLDPGQLSRLRVLGPDPSLDEMVPSRHAVQSLGCPVIEADAGEGFAAVGEPLVEHRASLASECPVGGSSILRVQLLEAGIGEHVSVVRLPRDQEWQGDETCDEQSEDGDVSAVHCGDCSRAPSSAHARQWTRTVRPSSSLSAPRLLPQRRAIVRVMTVTRGRS